jgi:AcrR family transcriptional regulator
MSPQSTRHDDSLARGLSGTGGVRGALLAAAREELTAKGTSGISLRAIARRAGVSHAAPKHHFGDRAGLLTALAVEGFRRLLVALEHAASTAPDALAAPNAPNDTPSDTPATPSEPNAPSAPNDTPSAPSAPNDALAAPGAPDGALAALGRAYLDAGLSDPALFELMFRPELLHRDDPDLRVAQQATFDLLSGAVASLAHPRPGLTGTSESELPLVAWAFVHGLVVLVRDGALRAATDEPDTELLAHRLTRLFADLLQ